MRSFSLPVVPLSLLLVACFPERDLSASEAIKAANRELVNGIPELKPHLNELEIVVRPTNGKWRVIYRGGTRSSTIDVDKRTGEATT
jgi:hypothetical protein